ncbi:hypothetical protein DPMN_185096 [Dreissena polymorpha]|uniref:Uncharacterized protein n=1 Tax=Dreissena polymorpha TaxID=45954 RepID=A0A9D4DJS2_DREPO|nr:hypothetical protein DPMN_185096 [Dreissena polymorpha]
MAAGQSRGVGECSHGAGHGLSRPLLTVVARRTEGEVGNIRLGSAVVSWTSVKKVVVN